MARNRRQTPSQPVDTPEHPYISPYERCIEEFLTQNQFFKLFLDSLQLKGVTGDLVDANLFPGDRYGMLSPLRLAQSNDASPTRNHGRPKFLAYEQDLAILLGTKSYEDAIKLAARTGLAIDHVIGEIKTKINSFDIVYDLGLNAPIDPFVSQEITEPHYWRVTIGTTITLQIRINTDIRGAHVLAYGNPEIPARNLLGRSHLK